MNKSFVDLYKNNDCIIMKIVLLFKMSHIIVHSQS